MGETIINSNQLRASGDTSTQTLIGANQIRQSGDSSSQTLLNKNQIASGGGGTPYLESDGNAWCYMTTSDVQFTRWEIDCAVDNEFLTNPPSAIFGYSSSGNMYGAVKNSAGQYGGFWIGSKINDYAQTTDRQVLSTSITSKVYYGTIASARRLFAYGTTPKKARLYSAKFYNGDTLVLDLVPKVENGVAGMYDNISGNFFSNQGSGSFTYGEE